METMSVTWGYLFFILALQTLRRRSVAVLPYAAVSALFPLGSLLYDLDALSLERKGAFIGLFLAGIIVQCVLIYRANRFWACEHALRHGAHIPAGIGGRERLKLLLAGIVLFVAHDRYFPLQATLFELLDRALFWALSALIGISALVAFATARHTAHDGNP
ncbi:MAG TPA: hypothetical protein PLU72_19570 [Candidatus Ozemobacteraceae bacterium]|nr:hypothetical protein [Candidatus Ozemobacteraceae bacterium]